MGTPSFTVASNTPLFCGVDAKNGNFVELTEESVILVPLTSDPKGATILCCADCAETTAKRVAALYGWAFAPIPDAVQVILTPKVEELADDDYDDDDQGDDDDTATLVPAARVATANGSPAAKPAPVKAAPVSNPPADPWAELDADIDGNESDEELEELEAPATVPAGGWTRGMTAPEVDATEAPDLNKMMTRAARSWAQENQIKDSEGKIPGNAGRLHASIKALYYNAVLQTPKERKAAITK